MARRGQIVLRLDSPEEARKILLGLERGAMRWAAAHPRLAASYRDLIDKVRRQIHEQTDRLHITPKGGES